MDPPRQMRRARTTQQVPKTNQNKAEVEPPKEEDAPPTESEQRLEEEDAEMREEAEMEAELQSATKEEMKFAEGEVIKKYTLNLAKKVAEFDETKTFSFREAFPAQESFTPELSFRKWQDVKDDIPEMEEPTDGLQPVETDVAAYVAERERAQFVDFVPHVAITTQLRPLRTPDQIPMNERVQTFQQLFQVRPDYVSMIYIENVLIDGGVRRQFVQQLAYFSRAEIVVLRNVGLSRVDDMNIVGVRYLDLSMNKISDVKKTAAFCAKCSFLQHLKLAYNPLEENRNWRPLIIAENPFIETINGVPVAFEERAAAVEQFGSKEMKKRLGYLKWDWVVSSGFERMGKPTWDPSHISRLAFVGIGLTEFHVGTLPSLQELDLSQNPITTLQDSGLQRCAYLHTVNFSMTLIAEKRDLHIFSLCPSLLNVKLEGIPLTKYRSRLIYECLSLKGTNRSLGLKSIDDVDVSIDEKIEAMRKYEKASAAQLDNLRWSYVLISIFGHYQLRTIENIFARVRIMSVMKENLSTIDVSSMVNLEVLEVPENNLTSIVGLAKLARLRYFDCTGNPKLRLQTLMNDLKKTKTLEHVAVMHDMSWYETKAAQVQDLRIDILANLLRLNEYLVGIDFKPIENHERVKAMAARASKLDCEIYAFNLAIFSPIAKALKRPSFHYMAVKPGKQYDPSLILRIEARDLGLSNGGVNLAPFVNAEQIDLSGNTITDIESIGLETCTKLRILDISSNGIRATPATLGAFFNRFDLLEVLAVRGNPVVSKRTDRSLLIGSIERMRRIDCNFRVVDTVVTTNERVAGWKRSGASDEECEKLRWQAILYQRCPKDVDPSSVTELDLSNSDLRTIDLSQFPNLEILSLRNNRLSSWAGMGLSEMKKLKVLDLRDNDFRTAEEIGNLTTHLPALEVVGVSGNRFSGKHYREDVISCIPMLQEITCPLHTIDESEITVDELVVAFNRMRKGQRRSKQEIEKFRFDAVIYRKKPADTATSAITALDLSECGLSVVDFSEFVSLQKISLRANRLKAKNLAESKLDRCRKITALDIRDNLINDAATIGRIIDELPLLSMVFVEGNPGIESLGDKDIRRRVRLLGKLALIQKVDSKLQYLDGRFITAAEKCRALKGILQPQQIEELRFQFVIKEMGDDAYLDKVDLSQEGLHFIHGIKQLHQITELDLSSNRLTTLRGQGLRELSHLRVLSIKGNHFEDLDEILCELRFCDSLKTLYMVGAGKPFDVIEKYCEEVFLDLRGLDVIDDVRNPWPLTTQQTEAVRYLHTYYQIGGNNLTEIDLRDRDIPSAHFWSILLALSDLSTSIKTKDSELETIVGVTTLFLSQGNFPHGVPSLYRFIVIYKLPSLMELDGVEISMDERANAEKQMRGIMVDSTKGDKLTLMGIRVAEQALMMKLASSGEEGEETGVVSSDDIDYSYIAENGDSMESMKEIRTSLAAASVSIASTGSALSKSEIVINYLQIFALLLLFDVPWPDRWIEMVEWTVMFNLSVDTVWPDLSLTQQYMKFGLIMAAPLLFLWLYKIKLNRTNWHKEYITHWTRAKAKYVFFWFLGMIFSLMIGVLINSKTLGIFSGKMPPADSFSTMIWISIMITLWILLLFFNARNFRKHSTDEEYWVRVYNRYRMRLALFFVTIFYMPVARTILMTYRCDSKGNLALYSDQDCARVDEPSEYPPMYYVAGVFAVVYIVCVPVFFAILIFRGSKEVERTYGLKQDDERVRNMKKEFKKDPKNLDLKFAFLDQKKAVENKYASGVQSWRSASSYLYSSYERGHKFMKILQMFVKFCLLCIAIFVGFGYIQPLCGFIVLLLFFMYGLLTRPFSDDLEDVMDLCSILANTITAFIAYLLKSDNFPSFLDATTALVVVNGANLVILFVNILIHPIRVCLGQRRLRKEQEKVGSGKDGGGGSGGDSGGGDAGADGVPSGGEVGGAAGVGGDAAGAMSGGADDILADHDIEMVMDSGEGVGSGLESGAGEVGGVASDGTEVGAGVGSDAVDAGAELGSDGMDAGAELGSDAVDAGAELGNDAVDVGGDAVDAGADLGNDGMDAGAELGSDGVDAGGELGNDAVDVGGDAVDAGGELGNDAVDVGGDAAENVDGEQIGDAAESGADAAGDAIGDIDDDALDLGLEDEL